MMQRGLVNVHTQGYFRFAKSAAVELLPFRCFHSHTIKVQAIFYVNDLA